MISSPSSSALNLISSSQHKAAEAAHTIATLPVAKDEVGSANFSSTDALKPVMSLKQAEMETSTAVKLLETEKGSLGSLFDAMA